MFTISVNPFGSQIAKVLKLAKGYFGAKHRLYKTAHEQVMHSLAYSYRDRRQVKRDMRKLWIARINAAARLKRFNLPLPVLFKRFLRPLCDFIFGIIYSS